MKSLHPSTKKIGSMSEQARRRGFFAPQSMELLGSRPK